MGYLKFCLLIGFILSFTPLGVGQYDMLRSETNRKEKIDYLLNNDSSPLYGSTIDHLHFFEIDSNFHTTAEVNVLENEKPFRMQTYDGTSTEYIRYAKVKFKLQNVEHELILYANTQLAKNLAYQDYLFLPFNDLTNGDLSYGGGRYIDLDKKDIVNGKINIDFNHVYNPYCAYSDGYRCPVPPKENRLAVGIYAGEKNYTGPTLQRPAPKTEPSFLTESEKKLILGQSSILYVLQTTNEKDLVVLKNTSIDIHWKDSLLTTLAEKMLATVQDPSNAGVGIAAPQIGINRNFICVQRFDRKDNPFEFYINPKITWRSEIYSKGREGCLSIPNLSDQVMRNYAISIKYKTLNGEDKTEKIEGFTAVIFQHEIDHLYGILFTDRLIEQNETKYKTNQFFLKDQ